MVTDDSNVGTAPQDSGGPSRMGCAGYLEYPFNI
jgi:hypothetical protein